MSMLVRAPIRLKASLHWGRDGASCPLRTPRRQPLPFCYPAPQPRLFSSSSRQYAPAWCGRRPPNPEATRNGGWPAGKGTIFHRLLWSFAKHRAGGSRPGGGARGRGGPGEHGKGHGHRYGPGHEGRPPHRDSFWAGRHWQTGPEVRKAMWKSRLMGCSETLWKFQNDDHRRRHHELKRARCGRWRRSKRGGLCMNGDQALRSRTGLAYFLATQCPPHNPPPRAPFLHRHPHFFARAATASLQTNAACPPSPSPSQYHQHHPHAPYPAPFRTSLLGLRLAPIVSAPGVHSHVRLLSTAARKQAPEAPEALEAAVPIFLPLLTLLKSSAALNVITLVSRIALTLLPLSLRAKLIYVVRERYLRNPTADGWVKRLAERGGQLTANGPSMRINAKFVLPALIAMPFILLFSIVVASYERTPVTGRPRIVMLSAAEEAELVAGVLQAGETSHAGLDWVTILRSVLNIEDEGFSPITGRRILLGGEVLDARDWRVRWSEAVLVALEAGVPSLAARDVATNEGILSPPPTKYPLSPRPAHFAPVGHPSEHGFVAGEGRGGIVANYDLLVIQRPEANAFSFGFGPEAASDGEGRRGVIVVYSGFLDEILGGSNTSVPAAPASNPPPARSGLFSNMRPPARAPEPVDLTTMPAVLPTPAQTKALAVLLSHELAHLVLSHTLESYASTSLLIPQISKLGSDLLRTLIFPLTAILGPFLNDSIGASLDVGAASGFGVFGQVVNSCGSRHLECEADLVALRLLAHSGIDPRCALNFWEDRLSTLAAAPPASTSTTSSDPTPPSSHLLRLHSPAAAESKEGPGHDAACGFLRTHPVNEDRVLRLRAELDRWLKYQSLVSSVVPVPAS